MPTPRSQAIHYTRAGGGEISGATESATAKIEHYAYMGMVIGPAVDGLMNDARALAAISEAKNLKVLTRQLQRQLTLQLRHVESTEAIRAIMPHIEALHEHRKHMSDIDYSSFNGMLGAGINTFIHTVETIYSRLLSITGDSTIASHPNNAAIIDRLSKMNLREFSGYRSIYLVQDDASRPYQAASYAPFETQFEPNPKGGMQFKPGFPASAPSIISLGQREVDYIKRTSEPPPELPTIGCPVSFEPHHTKALWELYAANRLRIDSAHTIGKGALHSTAGDSAASHQEKP
jgi:hypothetical protein